MAQPVCTNGGVLQQEGDRRLDQAGLQEGHSLIPVSSTYDIYIQDIKYFHLPVQSILQTATAPYYLNWLQGCTAMVCRLLL